MMKKLLFVLLFIFITLGIFAQNAIELNTKGFQLYEQKKYEEALTYFKKSFELDPQYHYPHYNYACTAAILLAQDYCTYDYLITEIYKHLEKTVQLKPQYKAKMMKDQDLKSVQDTYRFLKIAGFDPNKKADLLVILTTITWYGPKPGALPASPMVKFSSDGRIEIGDFLIAGDGEPGYVYSYGTYRVEGTTILIEIDDTDLAENTITAVFNDGIITFPDGELPPLSDNDDPCSA
ncbi:MAG: tetratricopeptide repeat protein [Spirochaetales bacterium]|nr:tetratricopeptide repeat protein [Spirochaetales bacterium]